MESTLAPPKRGPESDLFHFDAKFPEAINLGQSLDVFRRPGDDLIDRFDGRRLIRSAPSGDGFVPYIVDVGEGLRNSVTTAISSPDQQVVILSALDSLFIHPGGDWSRLLAGDPIIRHLDGRHPGIRPVLQHDLFTALIRSISAQQINLRWAATIRARLAQRYGDRLAIGDDFVYTLNPAKLAAADPMDIRALQFTTKKAESIVALAQEFEAGRLGLAMLRALSDQDVIELLVKQRGIGLWSAEWILCRTLGRPRVVAGDLGVRKAVGRAYLAGRMPYEQEVRSITAHWAESVPVAQALILHAYAVGTT